MKTCKECNIPKDLEGFYKHIKSADGFMSKCKECVKKINLARYFKNHEAGKAARKEWRENNSSRVKELNKQYYINNKDKFKTHRLKDSKTIVFKIRRKRYNTSLKGRSTRNEWLKKNSGSVSVYKHNYKVRRRKQEELSGWSLSIEEWSNLINKYNNRCAYCGTDGKLAPKSFRDGQPYTYGLTVEHVLPLTRGGQHILSNIVPACMKCQSHKCAKTLEEFGINPRVF